MLSISCEIKCIYFYITPVPIGSHPQVPEPSGHPHSPWGWAEVQRAQRFSAGGDYPGDAGHAWRPDAAETLQCTAPPSVQSAEAGPLCHPGRAAVPSQASCGGWAGRNPQAQRCQSYSEDHVAGGGVLQEALGKSPNKGTARRFATSTRPPNERSSGRRI